METNVRIDVVQTDVGTERDGWLFGVPAFVGVDPQERVALVEAEVAALDGIAANWKERNRPKVTEARTLTIELRAMPRIEVTRHFDTEEIEAMVKAIGEALSRSMGAQFAGAFSTGRFAGRTAKMNEIAAEADRELFRVRHFHAPVGWCTPSRRPITGSAGRNRHL